MNAKQTKTWKLKRSRQCAKCPWRKDVDPHDIPNGYDVEKHRALAGTIADPDDTIGEILKAMNHPVRIMACHETQDAHCLGWLAHQTGPGNNIALRMQMQSCTNGDRVRLIGDQHECFEDTLP